MYARSDADREDLFQEIVLQLWRNYHTYEGKAKVSTWMYRVALNTAISAFRKEKRRPPTTDGEAWLPGLAAPMPDPDFAEKRAVLYLAIQSLSDFERAIVLLFLEEHSYEEIATIVGITPNHVGVKLSRIKEKLKKKVVPLFE